MCLKKIVTYYLKHIINLTLIKYYFLEVLLHIYPPFGETILVIFYHFKWFENDLKNGLKNYLKNGLTLQIWRWYNWLRFKDIV